MNATLEFVIRYVDSAGALSQTQGGRALRDDDQSFQAVGLSDGSVVVVSRELDANGKLALFAKRFGAAGTQVGDDVRVLPEGVSEIQYEVVETGSGGYAIFYVTAKGERI